MAKAILLIKPDMDAGNPLEGSDWEVVSFLRHSGHRPFQDVGFNDDGTPTLGLKRKLKVGTAFMLKVYRHSCEVWSLMAEDPGRFYHHGAWDTSRNAGILLFTGNPKHLPKTYEERRKLAQSTIDLYSSWVNGGAVGFVLYEESVCDDCGGTSNKEIDSCWGFYSVEDAVRAAKENNPGVEFERAEDGF